MQAMQIDEALGHADEWIKGVTLYEGAQGWRVACATLAAEVRKLRVSLREHAKWADKAALVLATLEAENSDEEEQIQAIIDGISTWAPDAIMGPNAEFSGQAALSRSSAGTPGSAAGPTEKG